jgi:hypothetical protein
MGDVHVSETYIGCCVLGLDPEPAFNGVCRGAEPLCREPEGVPQNYHIFLFLGGVDTNETARIKL